MITNLTGLLLTLMLQSAAPAPQAETSAPDTAPKAEQVSATTATATTAEAAPITDKNHPDYVKCRSERVIGSLAKRKKTCMTNREWETIAQAGNRGTRDIVDSQQVGMNNQ